MGSDHCLALGFCMGRLKRLSTAQLDHIVDGPFRPPVPDIRNPTELAERAMEEIRHRGFRFCYKKLRARSDSHRIVRDWSGSTTVLGRRVLLARGFRVTQASQQAITLWHEIVHCEQVRSMGIRFYFRYLRPSWRATLEAEARVNEIVAWQKVHDATLTEGHLREMVVSMYGFYRLRRLDRDHFVDDVVGAIRRALLASRPSFDSRNIN